MKTLGIISYNIHCNFTNYGSALQSWALSQVLSQLGYRPILMDYCPDILRDKDPLDPMKNMWDKDETARKMCELSLPAIRENYWKFDTFYTKRFNRSHGKYTSANFNDCFEKEQLNGFVCGSDTIFCVDEFGVDNGYYANYDAMKGHSIAYAASFGDTHFNQDIYKQVKERLRNFRAIGIREPQMLDFISKSANVPCACVIDPTLLLDRSFFEHNLMAESSFRKPYLLYYSRRYNPVMEEYAKKIAQRNSLQVVEISLRAVNASKGACHEV